MHVLSYSTLFIHPTKWPLSDKSLLSWTLYLKHYGYTTPKWQVVAQLDPLPPTSRLRFETSSHQKEKVLKIGKIPSRESIWAQRESRLVELVLMVNKMRNGYIWGWVDSFVWDFQSKQTIPYHFTREMVNFECSK